MNLEEIFKTEKEAKKAEIIEKYENLIRKSPEEKITNAIEFFRYELNNEIKKIFHDVPFGKEYFYVAGFKTYFDKYQKIFSFEEGLEKAKKEVLEYHKGGQLYSEIEQFFNQGDENIISKLSLYTAYDEASEYLREWMEEIKEANKLEGNQNSKKSKIKWLGSPSVFGYIINQLVTNGYVDPPLHNGETNFTGIAKLFWEHFEITTTKENFIKEINPKKNTLSETKRAKINIPDLSDLN